MVGKLLSLKGRVVSAPLANISGSAFRVIARNYRAALVYSEMISAEGLVRSNRKTLNMLRLRAEEHPLCFQIFGHNPKSMGEAAKITVDTGCDMIDINFGCPAKKIVKNYSGAALMQDLKLVEEIISSVVNAIDIPVSVKFRSGWDLDNLTYLEVGKIAADCGASYVVLHPRTRSQGFRGESNWNHLKQIKQAVNIQVIGSGDIKSPQDARKMLDESGCDLVMIGRAAMSAPWIFKRIHEFLETGVDPGDISVNEKITTMLWFSRLMIDDFGERPACLKLRKHLAWFTRGWKNASQMRPRMFAVETYNEIENLLSDYLQDLEKVA